MAYESTMETIAKRFEAAREEIEKAKTIAAEYEDLTSHEAEIRDVQALQDTCEDMIEGLSEVIAMVRGEELDEGEDLKELDEEEDLGELDEEFAGAE